MPQSDKRRVNAQVGAGLPHLREFVMGSHVVLYAHSDTEVVLLSLKHQGQLTYITFQ